MTVGPDGYMGTVLALEGFSDSTVLLHGPHGCRIVLTAASGSVYPRPDDSCNMSTPFYRGMTRIPNTDVSSSDYIYGAYGKVVDALNFIKTKEPPMIAVVCSPGASLIGDDCQRAAEEAGVADRTIVLDAKLMSKPLNVGMDYAMVETLKLVAPEKREKVPDTVNLLGINILMKDWKTVVSEMRYMLSLMGLKVTCALGAGNSVQEARDSVTAQYNVVICPEFAESTVEHYRDVHGIEAVGLPYAPVGFRACFDFVKKVAEATGKDPEPALAYVRDVADRAYTALSAGGSDLYGKSFAIETHPSVAYPLAKMLYEDLSMVPAYIGFHGMESSGCSELLDSFLKEKGLESQVGKELPDRCEVLLADGNTAFVEQKAGHCRVGVDIGYPSVAVVDFRHSPVIGPSGVLYILDRTVNKIAN